MGTTNWPLMITVWLVLAIAGVIGYGYVTRPAVAPTTPAVVPASPTADEQLRTIAALAASNPAHAKQIAAAYADFAAVLERPETVVASKESFRSANQRFQAALWANDPARPQLPGFSAAANAYLLGKMGAESGAFDEATRQATVAALRDICKALGG